MTALELLLGLVIAVGLAGVLIPFLPGGPLVAGAVLIWAIDRGDSTGWAVFAVAAGLVVTGAVVKYLVPGRRLQQSGVPNRTLLLAALLGVAGFFVIPVVGLPIGFVAGVYLTEWHRTGREQAWPSTVAALKAVGLGILIELTCSTLAALTWLIAVLAT
jgi:uncharacterized protein YqgC (DUF456 family)